MPETKAEGCVAAAEGPIVANAAGNGSNEQHVTKKETNMSVMVGKEAPDFGATAYHLGGFKTIKLSDYKGKWVFLCFYPGDFTFV